MNKLPILFFVLFATPIFAQKDTAFTATHPVRYEISTLFSTKLIGGQLTLSMLLKQKEMHKRSQKIIRKERWLSATLGFYTQPELHNSLFLTGNYTLKRINPQGFYGEFRPSLGMSKTFLNEESYSVDVNNNVVLNKVTGDFYLVGGFALGIGKVFSPEKSPFLRDVKVDFLLQAYYPNFRFVALRPALQIGFSADLLSVMKKFKQKIIFKK